MIITVYIYISSFDPVSTNTTLSTVTAAPGFQPQWFHFKVLKFDQPYLPILKNVDCFHNSTL